MDGLKRMNGGMVKERKKEEAVGPDIGKIAKCAQKLPNK